MVPPKQLKDMRKPVRVQLKKCPLYNLGRDIYKIAIQYLDPDKESELPVIQYQSHFYFKNDLLVRKSFQPKEFLPVPNLKVDNNRVNLQTKKKRTTE